MDIEGYDEWKLAEKPDTERPAPEAGKPVWVVLTRMGLVHAIHYNRESAERQARAIGSHYSVEEHECWEDWR